LTQEYPFLVTPTHLLNYETNQYIQFPRSLGAPHADRGKRHTTGQERKAATTKLLPHLWVLLERHALGGRGSILGALATDLGDVTLVATNVADLVTPAVLHGVSILLTLRAGDYVGGSFDFAAKGSGGDTHGAMGSLRARIAGLAVILVGEKNSSGSLALARLHSETDSGELFGHDVLEGSLLRGVLNFPGESVSDSRGSDRLYAVRLPLRAPFMTMLEAVRDRRAINHGRVCCPRSASSKSLAY
jgi:hypothetical protein